MGAPAPLHAAGGPHLEGAQLLRTLRDMPICHTQGPGHRSIFFQLPPRSPFPLCVRLYNCWPCGLGASSVPPTYRAAPAHLCGKHVACTAMGVVGRRLPGERIKVRKRNMDIPVSGVDPVSHQLEVLRRHR